MAAAAPTAPSRLAEHPPDRRGWELALDECVHPIVHGAQSSAAKESRTRITSATSSTPSQDDGNEAEGDGPNQRGGGHETVTRRPRRRRFSGTRAHCSSYHSTICSQSVLLGRPGIGVQRGDGGSVLEPAQAGSGGLLQQIRFAPGRPDWIMSLPANSCSAVHLLWPPSTRHALPPLEIPRQQQLACATFRCEPASLSNRLRSTRYRSGQPHNTCNTDGPDVGRA